MRYLLDVNVLTALAFPAHASHKAAHSWFGRDPSRLWATCPLTQAGFLRTAVLLMDNSRMAVSNALAALEESCARPEHEFWPVDVDLRDLSASVRARLIGRNQIADMQLVALAHRKKGQLATFDGGIKQLTSGTRYEASVLLI